MAKDILLFFSMGGRQHLQSKNNFKHTTKMKLLKMTLQQKHNQKTELVVHLNPNVKRSK